MKATEKPWTGSWKIEPSKEGLWIPSRTKGETELVGFRGVIIRQGGISGALHTSPSRLKSQALFRETLAANVCHNIQRWLETAAGSAEWTDRTPTQLEAIQSGVVKECRNCGFGSCPLINAVKQRRVYMSLFGVFFTFFNLSFIWITGSFLHMQE